MQNTARQTRANNSDILILTAQIHTRADNSHILLFTAQILTRAGNSDILLFTAQIQTIKQYKYHQLMCEAAQIPRIVENAFLRLSS